MKLSEQQVINLGDILREERKNLDFSLEDVRKKLEDMGENVYTSDILRIEKGERKTPNPILLKNLCILYKLDVIKLFEDIGYLDRKPAENTKIKIYKNIISAFENPNFFLKEIDLQIANKNLIGIIERGNILLVEKNVSPQNNESGIFKVDGKYFLKKKNIISEKDIVLLGENENILIKESTDFLELGKVFGKIIFE